MDWTKPLSIKPRKLWFRPGTSAWLASHHASMMLRQVQRGREGVSPLGWVGFTLILLLVILPLSTATYFAFAHGGDSVLRPAKLLASGLLLLFFVTGISTSLMISIDIYTNKGDLDLLLTSPIDPKHIVSARLLASAWKDFTLYGMIALTALLGPILFISPKYLWFIPASIGLALTISSVAYCLAQWIIIGFGPNLGKKIVKTAGSLIALIWVLFVFYQKSLFTSILEKSANKTEFPALEKLSFFGGAFVGEFYPALILFAIGMISFLIARKFASLSFAKVNAKIAGAVEIEKPANAKLKIRPFISGFWQNLIFKEWRVMLRDPMTYIQAIAPLIGILPAMLNGFQNSDGSFKFSPEVYPMVSTMIAGQLVLALSWVAVSLEDASDLLVTSPQNPMDIIKAKIVAVTTPGFAIIILFAFLSLFASVLASLCTLFFGTLSITSSALIEFLRPRPTKRVKLSQKPDRSIISVFLSLALSFCWAIAADLATKGKIWFLLPFGIAIIVLFLAIITAPKFKLGKRTA